MSGKITIGKIDIEFEFNTDKEEVTLLISQNESFRKYIINEEKLRKIIEQFDDASGGEGLIRSIFGDERKTRLTKLKEFNYRFAEPEYKPGVITYSLEEYVEIENKLINDENRILYRDSVYISLPQKNISLHTIEKIQNACGEIMEVLGFELEQKEEPVFGSFFQKLWFKLTSRKTREELSEGYDKTKLALELQFLELPNADVTEKLSNAASNLITSLNGVDEAALRIGALLIVKQNIDGNIKIITETLSPELTLLFNNHPQLLNNPRNVYNMINDIRNSPNHFKEVDSVKITE